MNSQIMDESPTASIYSIVMFVISGIIFIGFTNPYHKPWGVLCYITAKSTSSHEESISISSHNELSEKLVFVQNTTPFWVLRSDGVFIKTVSMVISLVVGTHFLSIGLE